MLRGEDFPRPAEIKTYHVNTYDRISPKKSGFDGKGKTVFITGGTYGIGFAISRAFAGAGAAKIVILARSANRLQEAKDSLSKDYPNVQFETVQASVDDVDAVDAGMKSAGPIDVLVLNAFYTHQQNVPSTETPTEEIEKTFRINVVASYHQIINHIRSPAPASGNKTVIVVSSAAASLDVPMQAGYASSKAALSKLVSNLALEHSPENDGVRLVSFHPGAIYTETAAANFPSDAFLWEDVNLPGDFAVWLAGKESAFLHGRFIYAQWDVDELIAAKKRVESDANFLKIGAVF